MILQKVLSHLTTLHFLRQDLDFNLSSQEKNVNHWKELLKENMIHTIRILAANASNRSIRPESGSPTTLAILIASSACRQPMIPGTEN